MKMLIGALALALATPVAAQSAPAEQPKSGHGGHGEQHEECCKGCCDKMKRQGKDMACCDHSGDKPADHSAHANH